MAHVLKERNPVQLWMHRAFSYFELALPLQDVMISLTLQSLHAGNSMCDWRLALFSSQAPIYYAYACASFLVLKYILYIYQWHPANMKGLAKGSHAISWPRSHRPVFASLRVFRRAHRTIQVPGQRSAKWRCVVQNEKNRTSDSSRTAIVTLS